MRLGAVVSDLMLFSRIEAAAIAAGAHLTRVDRPADLPPDPLDLIVVDWSGGAPDWIGPLIARRDAGARIILFGPHTDLAAHAAARASGLGPMWARSRLITGLADVLRAPNAGRA